MSDTAALNLIWSDRLFDGLAAAGVRHTVISPGSRSTPLVLAVNRNPKLRSWHHPDERSAAFFALGLASHQRQPVALIATSGSAPGHWLPAVIEANRAGIPLILLSADRPPQLQACGANQTVDQIRLFGSQVRAFHDAGLPNDTHQGLAHIRTLGVRAVHRACGADPGPVHVNLPFQEPLTPSHWPPEPESGPAVPVAHNSVLPEPEQIRRIRRLFAGDKGLIICGPAPNDGGFADAVTTLAAHLGCPLLADPLSRLRFGAHDHSHLISRYDSLLRSEAFRRHGSPDWVIRFGAAPVSKALLDYLAGANCPTILCSPGSDWPDPLHQSSEIVRAQADLFCRAMIEALPASGPNAWLRHFQQGESVLGSLSLPAAQAPFEDTVIRELLDELPANATLFSSNSLPIRQLDLWSGQNSKSLRILANRGASGIDGNVSTLLGLAAAADGPVIGLLGDLALFHDTNGLLFARETDGVIVLFNNNGGGIFGMLPQAGLEGFEQQWLMPTNLDFSQTARLFGLDHHRVELQKQFLPALNSALGNKGVSLIEIMLNREASLRRQRAYLERAESRLAE
jgi:2-succinyl-5-enolpyruvyl-6-hydroxy-3-cyclohexene-1-carboxylate synthase